jgi:hypothetical protein
MKTKISMVVRADTTRNMSRSSTMMTFKIRIHTQLFHFQECNNTILTRNTMMKTTAKMRSQLKKIKRQYNQSNRLLLINNPRSLMKTIHAFKMKDCLKSMLICSGLEVLCIKMTDSIMMKMMTFNM